MRTLKYILMCCAVLVLGACKKKTTIKVHVENVATGEPYVDHHVFIVEQPPWNPFSSGDNETVYEGYTNEHGNILIEFKYKKNGKYSIWSNPPDDYCYA